MGLYTDTKSTIRSQIHPLFPKKFKKNTLPYLSEQAIGLCFSILHNNYMYFSPHSQTIFSPTHILLPHVYDLVSPNSDKLCLPLSNTLTVCVCVEKGCIHCWHCCLSEVLCVLLYQYLVIGFDFQLWLEQNIVAMDYVTVIAGIHIKIT